MRRRRETARGDVGGNRIQLIKLPCFAAIRGFASVGAQANLFGAMGQVIAAQDAALSVRARDYDGT